MFTFILICIFAFLLTTLCAATCYAFIFIIEAHGIKEHITGITCYIIVMMLLGIPTYYLAQAIWMRLAY